MSGENTLSLDFYKYLCQKIGNEDEVKVRRLTYIIDDLGIPRTTEIQITSGSKGEGLQLKGSDLDLMFIDPSFKVYESESDIFPQSCKCILLLMKTEDTHPCFTQLHLVNNHDLTVDPRKRIRNSFLGRKLSSELYALNFMENTSYIDGHTTIHGPCISSTTEGIDDITNHALRKCTDEKVYPWQIGLNQTQEYILHLLKRTELCTILKSITIKYPNFHEHSPIMPQELQLNGIEPALDLHPMIFAHFLSFLCYYHLHEQRLCKQSLLQLRQTIMQHLTTNQSYTYRDTLSLICLGIAHQRIGESYSARKCFLLASQLDEHNFTSAAMRLSNCNVD
ncbi:unnamed protein product [Mytilus edulis]|uniref:Cyclic GMP-AMP synthase n=1 Tax=Mytilus edulis TaxID=6550 RepID=A0A8S3RNC3_MYTED|nr:unnamed protein product [Mytilus edulis]